MAKRKENAPLYDANGRWVEERGRIKGAIRRTFRLFPQLKEAKQRARVELPPLPKKDGSPGARVRVRYRCAICQGLFSDKHSQVDHISPVVPLHMKEEDMSYDMMVRNICCGLENLQVICSVPAKLNEGKPSCHAIKTNEENFIRDILAEECRSGKWSGGIGRDKRIEELREEYKLYLAEKERLRLEKLKRKQEREAKRKGKNESIKRSAQ